MSLKVALIENEIQEIDNIDLHCMILLFNDMIECLDQRLDNDVRNLVGDAAVLLDLLQNKFHKLTG
jgi:hypothetical protein